MKQILTAFAMAGLLAGVLAGCALTPPRTPMQAATDYCLNNYGGKFLPMAECLQRQEDAMNGNGLTQPPTSSPKAR
jgi:hypothetical protein